MAERDSGRRARPGRLAGRWQLDRLPHPDGAGTWAEDGRQVSFLLEYDLGTEHLGVLAGKLDGYALLASVLADAGQAAAAVLLRLPAPGAGCSPCAGSMPDSAAVPTPC